MGLTTRNRRADDAAVPKGIEDVPGGDNPSLRPSPHKSQALSDGELAIVDRWLRAAQVRKSADRWPVTLSRVRWLERGDIEDTLAPWSDWPADRGEGGR
jgi:hypothetical protein